MQAWLPTVMGRVKMAVPITSRILNSNDAFKFEWMRS